MKGDQADPRMRASSKKRGIEITSISRPIRPSDFWDFDLILAMDNQNRGRFTQHHKLEYRLLQALCVLNLLKVLVGLKRIY